MITRQTTMTEGGHRSDGKHRRWNANLRHRFSTKHKLDVVDSPTKVESYVTNASYRTSTARCNPKKAVDPGRLSAESLSACKKRWTDYDNAGASKTGYSPVSSSSRTSKHPCDFRRQQSSPVLNEKAPRSRHDETRASTSLLGRIRHGKHRKNALIKESLEGTQDTIQQPKKMDDMATVDQATLPSSATVNSDKTSRRDVPECSLSKGRSSNDITERSTDHKKEDFQENRTTSSADKVISTQKTSASGKQEGTIAGEEIMGVRRSDEANWTRSSSTIGSLNTPVQIGDFESSNNTFCNQKLDLSNGTIISNSKTCPEAAADDAANKNVVAATSREQTSHVDIKSLAKQCTNRHTSTQPTPGISIDYKAGVKRKLASNDNNTLLVKIQKIQTDKLVDVNATIDDIQVSDNSKGSIHDDTTEDERVIEDNAKKRRMIRRRNKKYMKSKRDTRALDVSKMEVTKTINDIRDIFRSLFGENITGSESEEEHTFFESKYIVLQEKSINSCSTETRDSSDDDDMSMCKADPCKPIYASQRDVKGEGLVKMEREINPLVAADTGNCISRNGISTIFPVAKADKQETAEVAKANMGEYISKKEIRELLGALQRNLTKTVQMAFEKMGQNDRWSSEVKQMLREIVNYSSDKSSLSTGKDINTHEDSYSNEVLLNASLTKLISHVEGKENDNCDDLTLMKGDISTGDTSVIRADCEVKKKSVCEDEKPTVNEDSCINSMSPKQSINVDGILSSGDDVSNMSTVIINHSWTPMSPKGNICKDEVHIVNKDSYVNTFANQSSTNTDNNQPLTDDTYDTNNEVELEIKIKSKSVSTSETFSLKIPPSMRSEYIDNLKNELRRMILGVSSEMSATANKAQDNDASEEALDTDQVVITKNIEAVSSIRQVSCDADHATSISTDRSLQKENSQDDLRSSNDREHTAERNQVGNDQSVEDTQTTSIPAKNNAESSAPVRDMLDPEKSPPRNSPSESGRNNESILRKYFAEKIQFNLDLPTSVSLSVPATTDTTNSLTTVVSSRVRQVSSPTSTSCITDVSASSSTTTCVAVGNRYNPTDINEEIQLLSTIGKLIRYIKLLSNMRIRDLRNQQNLIRAKITLYNNIQKLQVLLLKNNRHCTQIIDYVVHRLNLGMLGDYPTSAKEIKQITLSLLKYMKSNTHPLLTALQNPTTPSISAQESSQSVESRSIAGQETPPTIGLQATRNTALRVEYPNRATETAINEPRIENNMNDAASVPQQGQNTANSGQQRVPSNTGHVLQLDSATANISLPRVPDNTNISLPQVPDNTNIPRLLQTGSPSANINWQQSSGGITLSPSGSERMALDIGQRHSSCADSTSTATENTQRPSNSTNNILLMPQSSPVMANTERRFSADTSNTQRIQQPEQRQSSANIDNIPRAPQTIPIIVNPERHISARTSNALCVQRPSSAMRNIERQHSSANIRNVPYAMNGDSSNIARVPELVSLLGSITTSISQQQYPTDIPYTSYISSPSQRAAAMQRYQQFVGSQSLGNAQETSSLVQPSAPKKNVSSLPTNAAASDNITAGHANSRATAFVPNAQQQANFQQQSSGSAVVSALNTPSNYTNVVSTAGNVPILANFLMNPQTQVHQLYRMPPPYFIPRHQPQSSYALSPLQVNATKTTYSHMDANQQSYVVTYNTTAKHSNNAPIVSVTVQPSVVHEVQQKTRSSQDVPSANAAAASGMPATSFNSSTNVPPNTQQSVINPDDTKKQKYSRNSLELARQGVPESPVLVTGNNIPQNPATAVGASTASLEPVTSQKKTTDVASSTRTRQTVSSESSVQIAQDASAKHADNATVKKSTSRKNPTTKSSLKRWEVKTPSTIVRKASSVSEDLPDLLNSPSNGKSQDTTQSTPSQSAAQIVYGLNLGVFTDIQKLIIQDHLETYFQLSFKKVWCMFTKQQLKMWKTERSSLRCFHSSLRKYLSKFKKDIKVTQEGEGQSLGSAGQSETTELRRDENLEEMTQRLRDDTNTSASTTESTSKDSSTRPQDEQPLRTSNSPEPATTKTSTSEFVKSPQRDEDTLCSRSSPEDSATETRDSAESNGIEKSVEQESQRQGSPVEQPSEPASVFVIDTQSSADSCEAETGSDAQQEQSDEILLVEEPDICIVDVMQHEPERLDDLSEDVKLIHLSSDSSDAKVRNSEVADELLTVKREFEELENPSEDIIDVSQIDLRQSLPDAGTQDSKIADERLMAKEKEEQAEEVFRDFDASEQTWYTGEDDRWKAQSIDTSTRLEDEEEEIVCISNELGTNNEQFGYSSEPDHSDELQAFMKNEEISDINIYENIIKGDIRIENAAVSNPTEIEDLETTNMLNILNVCSIPPTLYENIVSDASLIQNDQPQLLDEKENEELSSCSDNLEIVNEEDIPCLRCKGISTVCCKNCLAAYYCSERCSKLHWKSNHYKQCKSYSHSVD